MQLSLKILYLLVALPGEKNTLEEDSSSQVAWAVNKTRKKTKSGKYFLLEDMSNVSTNVLSLCYLKFSFLVL